SVAVHMELVNSGQPPNGTEFIGDTLEGGITKNTFVIDSGNNVTIASSTLQSGLRGLVVNSGNDIKVTGRTFHLNQNEGIKLAPPSATVSIVGNNFSESSQATTNTSSDIFVTAGVSNFTIAGNIHKDQSSTGKVCKDGIEIAAGGSDFYSITGDVNNG